MIWTIIPRIILMLLNAIPTLALAYLPRHWNGVEHLRRAQYEHLSRAALQQPGLLLLVELAKMCELLRHAHQSLDRRVGHVQKFEDGRRCGRMLFHRRVEGRLKSVQQLHRRAQLICNDFSIWCCVITIYNAMTIYDVVSWRYMTLCIDDIWRSLMTF